MSDQDYRALLDLIMCSDPWPVDNTTNEKFIKDLAYREAVVRGYSGWVEAYHNV